MFMPSFSNSPWMRGAPQPGFSLVRAADEVANLAWDGWTPGLASPNLPRPEEAKCVAVPGNDCFGFDDDQRRTPVRPDAGETDPQETVGCVQLRALLRRALKHADLMPQDNILQLQRSAGFQDG